MFDNPYIVAALYRFVPIEDGAALRTVLKDTFTLLRLCGTLLIAPEGINGTLAGSKEEIDQMLDILKEHTGLRKDDVKFSEAAEKPFDRLKIRLKREIITFNQPAADPGKLAGIYVAPQDWNALVDDPNVVVLDVRNIYETSIGTFEGAVDPHVARFTDFADYVRNNLDASRNKKIAMYCTGGIRCEKASAFMRAEGFPEVYHLKGGILKYLEEIPASESKWQGECFVFDKRVAVGQGLKPTERYMACPDCEMPLSHADIDGGRSHKCWEKIQGDNSGHQ